eukprot:Pgem_evm1s9058
MKDFTGSCFCCNKTVFLFSKQEIIQCTVCQLVVHAECWVGHVACSSKYNTTNDNMKRRSYNMTNLDPLGINVSVEGDKKIIKRRRNAQITEKDNKPFGYCYAKTRQKFTKSSLAL